MSQLKQDAITSSNSTQYNNIVSKYDAIYNIEDGSFPCGQLEEHNFHRAVAASIKGERVLDLACRRGHCSFRLLDRCAKSVLGVDIYEGMIAEAQKRTGNRTEAEFVLSDVTKGLDLSALGWPFEVAVGTWLLNYAASKSEVKMMFMTIKANLKPGGVFFGLTIPPLLGSREGLGRAFREDWAPYGTDGWVTGEVEGGFAVHTVLGMPGSEDKIGFDNFYLRSEVFEESCQDAGFKWWIGLAAVADRSEGSVEVVVGKVESVGVESAFPNWSCVFVDHMFEVVFHRARSEVVERLSRLSERSICWLGCSFGGFLSLAWLSCLLVRLSFMSPAFRTTAVPSTIARCLKGIVEILMRCGQRCLNLELFD